MFMNYQFNYFLGKIKVFLLLVLFCLSAQAWQERGNGGYAVYQNEKWLALDYLELSQMHRDSLDVYMPSSQTWNEKLDDLLSRPSPDDFSEDLWKVERTHLRSRFLYGRKIQPYTDYYYDFIRDHKTVVQGIRPQLVATNVVYSDGSVFFYTSQLFEVMPADQKAILALHEIYFAFMHLSLKAKPESSLVRQKVQETLFRVSK